MVLAAIDGEPVFGEFSEPERNVIMIKALNEKWPTLRLNRKRGDRIIGTITEVRRRI